MQTMTEWVANLIDPAGADGKVPNHVTAPAQMLKYLQGRRQTVIDIAKLRPLIRLADKNLNIHAEIEGEIDCSVEELLDDTGKCTITLSYSNWLADLLIHQTKEIEDLHILVDANPVRPNWRSRWGGKVVEIHVKQDEKGIHTIQLTALAHREHAKRLLIASNPIFPPEIAMPKMWMMPGLCRTAVTTTMFLNLARLFMPVWSTITNVFNPAAWFNPINLDAVLNFLPTAWPIQVAFVNPALDQSRWTVVGSTWTDWHSSFKDIILDAGCVIRAYTYLTTDEDSPNEELVDLLRAAPDAIGRYTGIDMTKVDTTLEKICAPKRNAVVFRVEQNDGRTGPTGTVLDGLLSTVSVTLDDLITPVMVNLNTGKVIDPGNVLGGDTISDATGINQALLFEKLTLTAPAPPSVIWWKDQFAGPIGTDLTFHKGSVKTTMTGGKSPILVNAVQDFAIKYGLSKLSDVIDWQLAAFNPQQAPATNGLDNLYNGELDDTLLAWQRFTDPIRALNAGDHSWQEMIEKGNSTAYTLATVLTLRTGNFKTRPYTAFKAQILNGHPHITEVDFFLGDRVGFENDGIIWVDTVWSIKREWSRNSPIKVSVGIGEDKHKTDPFAAAFRSMAMMYNAIGMTLGQQTVFS